MSDVPPKNELTQRLKAFRKLLKDRKVSAALITFDRNVRYLSGFTGHDSALLITASRKFLLTDFRYSEEARKSAAGWPVVLEKTTHTKDGKAKTIVPAGLMGKTAHILKKRGLRKLAFEPGDLRVADLRALRKACRGMHVKIKPEDAMVAQLRLIKSEWEVRQIEAALRIQEKCFLQLGKEIKHGMSERDAAAKLRYLMVTEGADDQAFEIMFQIGSNSSLPHGRPTNRVLKGNAIILLDFGCKRGGYHSDLTRTFFLGSIPPQLKQIHEIVMKAQQAAIDRIAPGVEIKTVDAAARDIIVKAGYGKAFGHSTGHGLGLEIHEAPSVSWRSNGVLVPGMVVTVEPGIYLPGVGGVRIEDDVLVTKTGHRVLSRLKRGLRWNGDN